MSLDFQPFLARAWTPTAGSMLGIDTQLRTPSGPRHLLVALTVQVVAAATAAGYRLTTSTDPDAGTTLADYIDVALISSFVAAYGAATVLLGTHLAALGNPRQATWSLQVAGACMLAAAVENVVEDGFKVDWLVWLWILLIAASGVGLLLAGGTLLSVRGTRRLGVLLAAPAPIGLALDFAGWLPAAAISGVGVVFLVARRYDRPRPVRQ
jgi:hypothetical protein